MKRIFSILSLAMILALLTSFLGDASFSTNAYAFANTIQVTSIVDTAIVDSQCTLREAIINTNNNNAASYPECLYGAGPLFIAFDTNLGTAAISLTSVLPAIAHTTGLTINGGGRITINGNNTYRVFKIDNGVTVTLDSLTVTGGKATPAPSCSSADDGFGGGIHNSGTLTIQNSTFSNNNAIFQSGCGGGGGDGGGIWNNGSLTISNSAFSSNTAGKSGGGVYNSGTLNITKSSFISDVANGGYGGGGVFNFGTLAISNSTFGGDTSAANGGGLYNHTGTATLTNNTFSVNGASSGGNVFNNNSATLNIYNTILANSTGGGDCLNNSGTVNAAYNINKDVTNGCGLSIAPAANNLIGFDPSLSSLYGSPGYFPLLANSVAIDAGDDAKCTPSPVNNTSQNGLSRSQGAHCDIGSYERDTVPPTVLSSVRANPDPTSATSVNFTVTFSEAVSNVDTLDFTLITTGSISGAAVTNAVGSGATSTVTVNTGSGSGTIRLDITDNDSIVDGTSNPLGGVGAGNGNFTSGQLYTIDKTPPNVNSITRASANPTSAGSVNFTIIFSKSVTGVNSSDFSLTTNGASASAVSGVSGSGSSYTVSVNTGVGSGTIRLDLINNGTIKDALLNPLGSGFTGGESYTITKSPIFVDVPYSYWANSYIERLYNAGITGGCTTIPLNYCPDTTVTRAQMAVFLLKSMHGSGYIPPPVGGSTGFADVPTSYWAAAWVKQLAAEGITSGCGGINYCPDATVTRAQIAVFLLKAKNGSSYTPPSVGGSSGFSDVSTSYWAAPYIKQLVADGITSGCGGGNYCPDTAVTRAQMAVLLVKAFNLP